MRRLRRGRVASFLLAVVVGLSALGRVDPAEAACDVGATCGTVYGDTGWSPIATTSSSATYELAVVFSVDAPMILHGIRWYRAVAGNGSQMRPSQGGYRLWEDGVRVTGWSGLHNGYADITDNEAIGWQETNLTGTNRRTLTPGHVYMVSYTSEYMQTRTRQVDYIPSPMAGVTWIAHKTGNANCIACEPWVTGTTAWGIDAMLSVADAPTPTAVPPTATTVPAVTFTPTITGATATATPAPPAPPVATQIDTRAELNRIATAIAASGNQQATAIASGADAQATAVAEAAAVQATAISNASIASTGAASAIQSALDAIGSTMGAWGEAIMGSVSLLGTTIGERIGSSIEAVGAANNAILEAQGALNRAASEAASAAATAASEAATAATTAATEAASAAATAASEAATAATTAAGEAVASGLDNVTGALGGIATAIGNIPGGVAEAIGDLNGAVTGALNGLGDQLVTAAAGAVVPSEGYLEGKGTELRSAMGDKVPALGQLSGISSGLAGGLTDGSCTDATGVPVLMWDVTIHIPGGSFYAWWCPFWRPLAGTLIVIASCILTVRRVMRLVSPPGAD